MTHPLAALRAKVKTDSGNVKAPRSAEKSTSQKPAPITSDDVLKARLWIALDGKNASNEEIISRYGEAGRAAIKQRDICAQRGIDMVRSGRL